MARWHALWLKPDLAPEIEHEVNIERLRSVARQQPVSAAAHMLNSLVLTAVGWQFAPHSLLGAGLALLWLGSLLQLHAWWRHRLKPRPSSVSDRTITKIFVGAIAFGGLWGGLTAVVIAHAHSGSSELFVCVVVAGMASGGTLMLYSVPAALAAFVFGTLAPPWLYAIFGAAHMPSIFHIYATVYVAFLLASARAAHATFIENVRLRIQNADLAYKAEEASRAKSRFLANISHELRTPLNAIIGFAEVIHNQFKGPVGNPQYIEFARSIHESGRHLVGIINDILDLSKVAEGKIELEKQEVDIANLIDRVVALMRQSTETAGLVVETQVEPGLPRILADPRKLDQILFNLLSNAVKFTPAGGCVRISARHEKSEVAIVVADTGVGIPEAELSEVLKPFVQSRDAERRHTQGTGLGLPLADQLVKLHGGTLTLVSARGQGTIVTVHLPVHANHQNIG